MIIRKELPKVELKYLQGVKTAVPENTERTKVLSHRVRSNKCCKVHGNFPWKDLGKGKEISLNQKLKRRITT